MPKSIVKGIWPRIVEAAKDARHSTKQTAIAKLCGIKQPSVHEWVTGESIPSREAILKIAWTFNVCVEWLWTGRGPKRPPMVDATYNDPISTALRDLWRQLNSTSREEVLRTARQWHALQDSLTPERFREMSDTQPKLRALKAPLSLKHVPVKKDD